MVIAIISLLRKESSDWGPDSNSSNSFFLSIAVPETASSLHRVSSALAKVTSRGSSSPLEQRSSRAQFTDSYTVSAFLKTEGGDNLINSGKLRKALALFAGSEKGMSSFCIPVSLCTCAMDSSRLTYMMGLRKTSSSEVNVPSL